MEVELIKEKTSEESMEEAKKKGYGTITPVFNFASGQMSLTDKEDDFNIGLGGDNCVYFHFGKGKRRVKFHLGKVLMEAYRLACEG